MMAKAPKDEFGTPFGQAGSAAAAKLGTPFGQAGSAPKTTTKLEPTVTIGGAPAGYKPVAKAPETPATPATPEAPATGGIPAMNNRAQEPGAPRKGYRWRWVSMSKTNNPYGGEWREEWAGGVQDGGGDTGKGDGNATQDLLLKQQRDAEEAAKLRDRQSAYDILYNEFNKYGLGNLVEDIKYLLQSNVSPSQFALELRNTEAYKKRFSANQNRIKAGLRALGESEYIGLEDQYQNIMRNYGLPSSYWTKDATGKQAGFDKFLEGDVSAAELEDRIVTAQQRVINSNPEVLKTLKQFYPDITNGDILAYTLDPNNALTNIKRKVTAAEIGGAALAAGLDIGKTPEEIAASEARAQMLAGYGVNKQQAMTGFQTVADIAPRGSQLAEFYNRPTYNQMEAEKEVFNLEGAAAARKKRKQLADLEQASFSGASGVGALGRDKAIYGGAQGQAGLY
jgi:hypothetical protein